MAGSQRCSQCTIRKKRCDRTRPKCGRCRKVGLKCSLDGSGENTAMLAPVQDRFPSDPFQDVLSVYMGSTAPSDFPGRLEPYFKGLNKWLPVVDEERLYRRWHDLLGGHYDASVSLLILSCFLLVGVSQSQSVESRTSNLELYVRIVSFRSALLMRLEMSLEVLQVSVLLALYEHLEGSHVAAAGTIASATRIADGLGYLHWHCGSRSDEARLVDEEGRRIAWCLYALERMIVSVHYDDDLAPASFSCPTPCLKTSLLDQDLCLGSGMSLQCKKTCGRARPTVSIMAKSTPSWFSRLCQAALLLEMAISDCHELSMVDESDSESRIAGLDGAINMLATSLLQDRNQGSHINCSLLAMCVSAMIILHDRTGNQTPNCRVTNGHEHHAVIDTAIRMVFDRANIVPFLEYRHSQVISLWELHCFFHSAEIFFRHGLDKAANASYQKALRIMKSTFEEYKSHWGLAGQLLLRIRWNPTILTDPSETTL